MGRRIIVLVVMFAVVLAAACSSGPVRRISEPAASIQQLAVQTDGSWRLGLRLQNYSSISMRFEAADIRISIDGEPAGALQHSPGLEIGPESADVVSIDMQPDSGARMLLADALATGRRVEYELGGTIQAAPADRGSSRSYKIERKSALSPTPGLPGVLR